MLDPQTSSLLEAFGKMTADQAAADGFGEIGASRAYAAAVFKAFAGPDAYPDVVTEDIRVRGAEAMRAARSYRPAGSAAVALPTVIFFHGGGWVMGDLDSYDGLMRALSSLSGARFVSIDYRLAPEHPFPAGLDDALAATRWIAANGTLLGVDPARLALMGDSAGGNLAACVCQLAAMQDNPPIAGLYLLYPVIDATASHDAYPSRIAFGNGDYLLTRAALDATRDLYLGTGKSSCDPRVSPLYSKDLARLPHTMILTAGHDPLRDEGRTYFDRLRAAGVDAEYRCFATTIHAFMSFGVLDVAHAARRALAKDIDRTLRVRSTRQQRRPAGDDDGDDQ